jgi:hypothetical protein
VRLEVAFRTLVGVPVRAWGTGAPSEEGLAEFLAGTDDRRALAAVWLAQRLELRAALREPARRALASRGGPAADGDLIGAVLRAALRLWCDPADEGAMPFLDGHLNAAAQGWHRPDQPLPDGIDLLLVGLITQQLGGAVQGARLQLPTLRLWTRAMHRGARQVVAGEPLGSEVADDLWLLAGAGVEAWIAG